MRGRDRPGGFEEVMPTSTRRWLIGMAIAVTLATSVIAGTPPQSELPQVALDWPLLLHVERAAALVGVVSLVTLMWWRAGKGQFPIRFGNIEYAIEDAAEVASDQEERIAALESAIEGFVKPAIDSTGSES
jgi:hypothetical protein